MSYLTSSSTKMLLEKAAAARWTALHAHRQRRPLRASANMRLWDATFDELERRWLEAFPLPRLVVRPLSPLFVKTLVVEIDGVATSSKTFDFFKEDGHVRS